MFAGCVQYSTIGNEKCYKILWINNIALNDYSLISVQSIKSKKILYIVSKHLANNENEVKGMIQLEKEMVIESDITPVDSLVITSRIRGRAPGNIMEDDGSFIIRSDTLVVKVYVTKDISGLFVKSEHLGCKKN